MTRTLAAAVLLMSVTPAPAADAPAGSWRFVAPGRREPIALLVSFEQADGRWAGKFLGASEALPQDTTVVDVGLSGTRFQFTVKAGGDELTFDGKLPAAAGQAIPGSVMVNNQLVLTTLEPSKLTAFDRFEFLKEVVARDESGPALVEDVIELLNSAGLKRVPVGDVRGWVEKADRTAEAYGVRWQQAVAQRQAQALAGKKEYAAIALAQAQRAERLLTPSDPSATRVAVLETLARLLRPGGDAAELRRVEALLGQAEARDYEEYLARFPFKPDPYPGRQGPGNRVVLVELFTGAESPADVAADLAYDGLARTYKPTEVLRLQFHLDIPFPDPLTNATAVARQKYYGVTGTPSAFVNGKPIADAGGPAQRAVERFTQYRKLIDTPLELPAMAKVGVTAARAGDRLTVRAKVSELAKPGERMRLRLFVAEEVVRHSGGNGVRYHHMVVRGAAGAPGGFPLRQATSEHAAELGIGELRKALAADLEKFEKYNGELPNPDRLLALKKLVVVALVQDDGTQEVIQSAQAEVR
jgi:hypothetical protein